MSNTEFDWSVVLDRAVATKLDAVGCSFFIWIGVALLAGVNWAVFFMGTGVIMLGAQAARSYFGLRLDRFALVLGIVIVGASALRLLNLEWEKAAISAWLVPALFIAAGASIVWSAWRRGSGI